MKNELVLFESQDGNIRLDVNVEGDTVWLTQAQMILLFERDQSVISRHINNAFKEEVEQKSNINCIRSEFVGLKAKLLKQGGKVITKWNEELWSAVIDCVVIGVDGSMTFRFKNGTEIVE